MFLGMRHFNEAIREMVRQRDAANLELDDISGEVSERFKSTCYAPTYKIGMEGNSC